MTEAQYQFTRKPTTKQSTPSISTSQTTTMHMMNHATWPAINLSPLSTAGKLARPQFKTIPSSPSALASNPVPNSQSLICALDPILTFEHRIVFSILALAVSASIEHWRERTNFSSITTKSHNTQPVNLAPFPITQWRPITHFLILALSPTLVVSWIKLSGLIWASADIWLFSSVDEDVDFESADCPCPCPWPWLEGDNDLINLLLSSQYPANEFARMRWSGSGGGLGFSLDPLGTGTGSTITGAVMTIWHL